MTKTTACTECSRPVNARNSAHNVLGAIGYHDVCHVCYDVWGWENSHTDGDHDSLAADDEEREGCYICYPELRPYPDAKKVSTSTGRSNRSHADCDHARTPAARSKCRKANA
jgi:hypothetical protein